MSQGQQYESNELFHFVGRHEPTLKARFELLLTILNSGILQSSKFDETLTYGQSDSRLFSGELTEVPAVCFCDIPREFIGLHMKKYSQFGLSFSRRFLSDNGAKPVIYVPLKSTTSAGKGSRGKDLPHQLRTLLNALSELQQIKSDGEFNTAIGDSEVRQLVSTVVNRRTFLTGELYFFIKTFDEDLESHHAKNYYMEREWRIAGNPLRARLKFSLSDVKHVIVPKEFERLLLAEMPELRSKLIGVSK